MATKTPALSTQLKTAKAEIVVLQEKIVKLGTEVKQQSEYKDMYYRQKTELEKEIEAVHSLLDVLEGAIPRKTIPDATQEWNTVKHDMMTRLAAYLAKR
jgi:predicted  nucleic acid-binding Zn-ribbon protein